MISGLRLPFEFEPELLKTDLGAIRQDEWRQHYNRLEFRGSWSGVALRSASGDTADLNVGAAGQVVRFENSPALGRCPYFRQVLKAFQCPLKAVRLLNLAAGSSIAEHSDHALDYEDGEIRIHIPIRTSPAVEFYLCGERLLLEEGGCYYVNVNLPHRVKNRGEVGRVHLVIDAVVNRWVEDLFRNRGREIPRGAAPLSGIDDFRRAVLSDATLQRQLQEIECRHEFIDAVVRFGQELGFDFDRCDAEAAFRGSPTPLDGCPQGWTPARVAFPEVETVWTGATRFTEPFFEDTVRVCRRNPFAAWFRGSVRFPARGALAGLQPAGFIFHMSRCGSTLVSRLLATLDRTVVISEAPPVDEILRSRGIPNEEKAERLRWLVALLGQPRAGAETHLIFKLDAWHLHAMPVIRAAFPETPWVLVRRRPAEILESWMRQPARQSVPGELDAESLGLDPETAAGLDRRKWCELTLAALVRAADRFERQQLGTVVDYRELPGAATRIARCFGLELSIAEAQRMAEAGQFDSKNPGLPFTGHGPALLG